MGVGVGGIEADCVAEFGGGLVELALSEQGVAGVSGDEGALLIHVGAHERGGEFALGDGKVGFVLVHVDGGQEQVSVGGVGHLADGLLERGLCLWELVELAVDAAEHGPAFAVVGMGLEGEFELRLGVSVAALLKIEQSKDVGRLPGLRVELFGGGEFGDGGVGVVLHFVGEAEVVVQFGRVGIEDQGGFEFGDGVVDLVELNKGGGEVLVSHGVGGREGDGAAQVGNAGFGLLLLGVGHAEVNERVGVVGTGGERLLKERNGGGELALALEDGGELRGCLRGRGEQRVCALKDGQSLRILTRLRERTANFKLNGSVVGGKLRGFEPLSSCVGARFGGEDGAEVEMGDGEIGLSGDGGAEAGFGCGPVVAERAEGAEFVLQMGVGWAGARGLGEDGRGGGELAGGGK